jgi:hypothetical protein
VRSGALLVLLLAATSAFAEENKQRRLIEFEIIDQFDDFHSHEDYVDKTLVVVGGNKGSADYNEPWAVIIQDSLEASGHDDVAFLGLADLRGVPWFMKGFVRGKFPEREDRWALMDWKGEFAKAYCFEKNMANIVVFAPDGSLVHHAWAREIETAKLDLILRAIRRVAPSGGGDE